MFARMFVKQLKVGCSPRRIQPMQARLTECSKSRCEASLWARACPNYSTAWLDFARVHGSHHVFTMAGRRERIVIPLHGNQPLKKGLLRSLMKIAGLTEDDL